MPNTYKVKNVEAMQLRGEDNDAGEGDNAGEVKEWCGGRESWIPAGNGRLQPQIVLETREGTRVANVGDYIVKLSDRDFTVLREREFEAKYEQA